MRRLLASLAAVTTLAGCSGAAETQPVKLVPISHAQWTQILPSLRPDIVVVDLWATWCAPCIERFPHMVAMHHRYAGRGVRFVSMSLEDREDTGAIAGAERFLGAQEASFANYRMDENILDAFDKLELGTIPAVLVYGRDGRERYRLTGDDPNNQFTEADVEAAIVALLAEAADP